MRGEDREFRRCVERYQGDLRLCAPPRPTRERAGPGPTPPKARWGGCSKIPSCRIYPSTKDGMVRAWRNASPNKTYEELPGAIRQPR